MVSGKTCGTCEMIRGGECIITRYNRRSVTENTAACNEYSEDLTLQPMKEMTLRELGFTPDPTVGRGLQLLGFVNGTLKIGDEENARPTNP